MKAYYLHLTEADFVQDDLVWTSGVIDLYDNASYKNYSTTKSFKGLNSLGNGTWTGLVDTGVNTTDAGEIDGDRFIDHTGRIDIRSHALDISNLPGNGDVAVKVNVYTIDDDTIPFPDGWAQLNDITLDRGIMWVDSYRYVRFQLVFTTDQNISGADLTYDVRIHIDKPVMGPMYDRTREVLNKFPEWMAITNDALEPEANPELATPGTLGGKLINSVAGEWLDDITKELDYVSMQRYVMTADLNQVAWIYYTAEVPSVVYLVEGDGVQLAPTADLREFYEADEDAAVYWWDEYRQNIYFRQNYTTLEVNGVDYVLQLQQVWNWYDEHGLIVDLYRHRGEDNLTFRSRILDVYLNQPGVGLNAFKLALRRELNLWKAFDENATPDSFAEGATPEVLEISDIEVADDFVQPDNLPTNKFKDLVEFLAEQYPVTWGYFRWNKALWDIGGEENKGFGVLPYTYDATPIEPPLWQAGIGDGADLFVYRPDDITGPREFTYRLKVRGRGRTVRDEWPEITISADIYAQADKEIFDNPVLTPWFTIIINDGVDDWFLPVQATVQSDVSNDVPTPTEASYFVYTFVGIDGLSLLDQTWYDADGNAYSGDEATPFQFDFNFATPSIMDVSVQWGRFDPDTQTFTDYPADGSATLWFSDEGATVNFLIANDDDQTINAQDPNQPGSIVVVSNETDSSIEKWTSEPQPYLFTINGALPNNTELDRTIEAPVIMWDPYLEATPNKEYIVQLTLVDSDGNYVVSSTDAQGSGIELADTVISVNGDNSWVDGQLIFDADTTTEFTFSSGTSVDPEYPIETSTWGLFEAVETEVRQGVVDENGPWRNGYPQEKGAFNFLIAQADVGRADFTGLTNDEDTVITWIGVEVLDDNRVIAWLDTNVVNPATDDDNEVVYPATAIDETYDVDLDNYIFEPFFIRARMRPEIDPHWNPQVHSGWFYENQKEYYMYANPVLETATATDWILADVARQGAPIIVKTDEATPIEYRQVAFFDPATPELSLENIEIVNGSGINRLYVAYEGVFDISITDLATGDSVPSNSYSETNEIVTAAPTDRLREYEVTYKVDRSFYADHEYVDVDNKNKTALSIIERVPYGGDYSVAYEGSDYDPATPVDLPLNTFYTTLDEGFIFLSHTEFELHYIQASLSPTKFIADGEDYLIVSLRSFDEYFNPKGNQTFELTTTFGTFESTGNDTVEVTTDNDGFANVILISENSTVDLNGYVEIDGPGLVDATVNYEIQPLQAKPYRLVALPSADNIPADNGESAIHVYGKVEDDGYMPIPYASVAWKRARSMPEVWQMGYQGQVVADEDGLFSVGPIESSDAATPGYWFMVLESWFEGASPSGEVATPDYDATPYEDPSYGPIGDVVFWNEYPDIKFGVNEANELPKQAMQMEVNSFETVYYSNENAYPVTYDDATPYDSATPVSFEYEAPNWYAINRYLQYQLGLLGTGFYSVDLSSLADAPPDYKDL